MSANSDGPKEGFIRPDHNDFKTSEELKQSEFSGVRSNSITGDFEFWIVGELVRVVTKEIQETDPGAIYKAHKEVFKL